ncbi:MAG: helix-turn-helix domain-containing protein [Alphaproteobacteria bacterium]|jgi:Cu(I)-responsive transcriptional regulator
MMSGDLTIGDLGRQTGCKVQTIRYYEQIGLMPEPLRTSGNQRRYNPGHAERLAFIRHSRELGFSLDAIRKLLDISDDPERSCETVDRIARDQLEEVDRRIRSLNAMKGELERMILQCRGDKVADCRIIEILSDHSQCLETAHDPGCS